MSKLTKMQINHIQARLLEMKNAKLEVLKGKLPNPNDFEVESCKVGLEWGKQHPSKFVKIVADNHNSNSWSHNYLSHACDQTPPVKASISKVAMTKLKNKERECNAELALRNEITRILDDLYLGGVEDATKALTDFSKFNV